MTRPRLAAVLLAAVLLSGCTQFPELDARTTDPALTRADYPALVPVGPLLDGAEAPRIAEGEAAAMAARVARLKARAARLRATVVDGGTRRRMADGVAG